MRAVLGFLYCKVRYIRAAVEDNRYKLDLLRCRTSQLRDASCLLTFVHGMVFVPAYVRAWNGLPDFVPAYVRAWNGLHDSVFESGSLGWAVRHRSVAFLSYFLPVFCGALLLLRLPQFSTQLFFLTWACTAYFYNNNNNNNYNNNN